MASANKIKKSPEPRTLARPLSFAHAAFIFVLIAVLATIAYSNTFGVPFVFDDSQAIVDNKNVRHLATAFSPPDMTTVAGRPFINFTLAINYAISGYRVWSYHVFNLLVHILTSVLLFGIVRRTLVRPKLQLEFGRAAVPLALISALIFALHPLQTESVTYTIQRCESVMGFFFLATLYLAIRGWDSSKHRLFWHILAVLSCAAGMASKEVMVGAPILVLLYDRIFNTGMGPAANNEDSFAEPEKWRPSYAFYGGLAATWLVLALILMQGGQKGASNIESNYVRTPPLAYLVTQGQIILHYLRLSVWPSVLCIDYGWPCAQTYLEVLPFVEIVGVMVYLTVRACIKSEPWGFLGAWFFLILAPTSSILPITDLAFEHRMYVPLAAVIVLIVAAIYRTMNHVSIDPALHRWGGLALASLVICAFGIRTYIRNQDYRSDEAIWDAVLAVVPDNARAHNNRGNGLFHNGHDEEALKEFRRSVALDWHNADALDNLGNALNETGQMEEALKYYDAAIRLKPNFTVAYSNRGTALGGLNRNEEAIESFKECLKRDPDSLDAHINMGVAYDALNQHEEAARHFQLAVSLATNNPSQLAQAYNNLGHNLAIQGKTPEAMDYYKKAIATEPRLALALYNMAVEFDHKKQWDDALKYYRDAANVKYPMPPPVLIPSLTRVGVILTDLGRPEEALDAYRTALKQNPKPFYCAGMASDILEKQNRMDEAIALWEDMVAATPDHMCHFRFGVVLNHSRRPKDAIVHFKKAMAELNGPEVHTALANSYQQLGDNDSALNETIEALRFDPNSMPAIENVSEAIKRMGHTEDAVSRFKAFVVQHPESFALINALGCELAEMNKYAEAIGQFSAAVRLDPANDDCKKNLARALLRRGEELEHIGRLNEAIDVWKMAVQSPVNSAEFHHHLGQLLLNTGKPSEAIPHFEEELRSSDINAAGAHTDLGFAYAQLGKDAEAISHFKEVLKLEPDSVNRKFNIARAMSSMRQKDEAIKVLQDIVQRTPDYTDAYNELAQLLSDVNRDEEAVATMNKLLSLKPDYPGAEGNLAIIFAKLKKVDEAIVHYKNALRLKPNDLIARENYAHLLIKRNSRKEALDELDEIIRLSPRNVRAYTDRGNCLSVMGKTAEAIEAYNEALKLDPLFGEAHNGLGAILAEQEKFADAANHFRAALKADPGDTAARENLNRVMTHLQK